MKEDLKRKLVVGAKVRIGKKYAKEIGGLAEGEVITLIEGSFDYDNGLYSSIETAPSIWNEHGKDFDSIFHLFGNDFENFMDCKVVNNPSKALLTNGASPLKNPQQPKADNQKK